MFLINNIGDGSVVFFKKLKVRYQVCTVLELSLLFILRDLFNKRLHFQNWEGKNSTRYPELLPTSDVASF